MEEKYKEILEKHKNHSDNVLQSILNKYEKLIDTISEDDFKDLEELFAAHPDEKMTIQSKEKLLEKLKSGIMEDLRTELTAAWQKNGIANKITMLEHYKEIYSDDSKKWRPTGKSVQEQIRPCEVEMLLKKKKAFERHINNLEPIVKETIDNCYSARNFLKELSQSQTELSKKVDLDMKILQDKQEKMKKNSNVAFNLILDKVKKY